MQMAHLKCSISCLMICDHELYDDDNDDVDDDDNNNNNDGVNRDDREIFIFFSFWPL